MACALINGDLRVQFKKVINDWRSYLFSILCILERETSKQNRLLDFPQLHENLFEKFGVTKSAFLKSLIYVMQNL